VAKHLDYFDGASSISSTPVDWLVGDGNMSSKVFGATIAGSPPMHLKVPCHGRAVGQTA